MHQRYARLWRLDPDVVHLNHGSFGATPTAVLEYQHGLQEHLESNPTAFELEELWDELDRSRASLARFVNADADGVAFVPNTTHGVNTVLRSLDFEEGDEILITDHGYEACGNAAAYVADKSGASLRTVALPAPVVDAAEVTATIVAAVTSRTKLALIDHVTSSTALVLPIRDIVDGLRTLGVTTLVDGAHAPGMVPVDVAAIGADVYVANCHKWLCAPKGAAFLCAAPSIRDELVPLAVGYGYTSTGAERSRFRALFDWTGTDDPTAYLSVPKAIEILGTVMSGGWDAIIDSNHTLALAGRSLAHGALDSRPTTPHDMIGSMAAIPLPDLAGGGIYTDPLQTYLREKHNIVIPVTPGPRPSQRWLRLSAQIYNDAGDFERLAEALAAWSD